MKRKNEYIEKNLPYREERRCTYKKEEYLVRDSGEVMRLTPPGNPKRPLDEKWTFGRPDSDKKKNYLYFSSEPIHRIVAVAFLGDPPTSEHVVDHIDTNRQNNRPSNLRWVTKLENVVFNEFTRRKIEDMTGVSIYEFLENPKKYSECFHIADSLSWMRSVDEEEAAACLENFKKWVSTKKVAPRTNSAGIGEWIFRRANTNGTEKSAVSQMSTDEGTQPHVSRRTQHENFFSGAYSPTRKEPSTELFSAERAKELWVNDDRLFDSLTPTAKQDWITATVFPCCPQTIPEEPIQRYIESLIEGATFSSNKHTTATVLESGISPDGTTIIVRAEFSSTQEDEPPPLKPYTVAKIIFENGFYIHKCVNTFFEENGSQKTYMQELGLEWTGGECFDDYCS